MRSKGKPAFYRNCPHCKRPFRTYHSNGKRRHTLFCTRQCYFAALRAFLAHYWDGAYRPDEDKEISEAA